jgi:hypothetical protein
VDIAYASWLEDPALNPARVKDFQGNHSNDVVLCIIDLICIVCVLTYLKNKVIGHKSIFKIHEYSSMDILKQSMPDLSCARSSFWPARRLKPCPWATGRLSCSAGCPRSGRECSRAGADFMKPFRTKFTD